MSGLTTAVCLAEAGLAVSVVAGRPPGEDNLSGGGGDLAGVPQLIGVLGHVRG